MILLISLGGRLIDKELPLWFVESYGFMYGIALYNLMDKFKQWADKSWPAKTICLFLICGIFGVSYGKFKLLDFWGDYCLRILLGIALILLILILLRRFEIGNKALKILGSISYEVYLLHGTVFTFLMDIDKKREIESGPFIIMALMLTLLVACLVRSVSNRLCKWINRAIN